MFSICEEQNKSYYTLPGTSPVFVDSSLKGVNVIKLFYRIIFEPLGIKEIIKPSDKYNCVGYIFIIFFPSRELSNTAFHYFIYLFT